MITKSSLPRLLGLALFLFHGCDKGLVPTEPPPGPGALSGLITYASWPPPDSLFDLRIVAFRDFPPEGIVSSVLGGEAAVYPPIGDTALVPFFVDSLRYAFDLPSGRYEYLAVAQQYGPNLFTDWRPVGQYDLDTNLAVPTPIDVPPGDTLRNIIIHVDFANPPPAPF
jgi:hypothetical protein